MLTLWPIKFSASHSQANRIRHLSLSVFQSRDCAHLGPPEVGEVVQVKWPDGLFYEAKYLGSNTSYMYQVSPPVVSTRERCKALWVGASAK